MLPPNNPDDLSESLGYAGCANDGPVTLAVHACSSGPGSAALAAFGGGVHPDIVWSWGGFTRPLYSTTWYPCPDSNRGTRFRKPLLYPPELQGHLGAMPAEPCPGVQPGAVSSVTIVAWQGQMT